MGEQNKKTSMRCGFYTVNGEKCWIPRCYGGIYGKDGCYCYHPHVTSMHNYHTKKDQLEQLEDECKRLKRLLEESQKKLNIANNRVFQLERSGIPLSLRRKLEKDSSYMYIFIKRYYG